MKAWRRLAASQKGRIFLVAVATYLIWHGWLMVTASGKIASGLLRAGETTVDVWVTLPFPPERFHVLFFQKFGRVSGTEDRRVELRGVRVADLRAVARPYWVARVEPIPTEQRR